MRALDLFPARIDAEQFATAAQPGVEVASLPTYTDWYREIDFAPAFRGMRKTPSVPKIGMKPRIA